MVPSCFLALLEPNPGAPLILLPLPAVCKTTLKIPGLGRVGKERIEPHSCSPWLLPELPELAPCLYSGLGFGYLGGSGDYF